MVKLMRLPSGPHLSGRVRCGRPPAAFFAALEPALGVRVVDVQIRLPNFDSTRTSPANSSTWSSRMMRQKAASSAFSLDARGRDRCRPRIRWKRCGSARAPRRSIRFGGTWVCASTALASAMVRTSPLAMTGIGVVDNFCGQHVIGPAPVLLGHGSAQHQRAGDAARAVHRGTTAASAATSGPSGPIRCAGSGTVTRRGRRGRVDGRLSRVRVDSETSVCSGVVMPAGSLPSSCATPHPGEGHAEQGRASWGWFRVGGVGALGAGGSRVCRRVPRWSASRWGLPVWGDATGRARVPDGLESYRWWKPGGRRSVGTWKAFVNPLAPCRSVPRHDKPTRHGYRCRGDGWNQRNDVSALMTRLRRGVGWMACGRGMSPPSGR